MMGLKMIQGYDQIGRRFLIREARPEDAEDIIRILDALAKESEHILLTPDEVIKDKTRKAHEIARASMSDGQHIAVVEVGYEVAGMLDLRAISFNRCKHVVELGLGLLKHARNVGIGSKMMEYAISIARNKGFRKIRLFVISSNIRAKHVYEKFGFIETGRFIGEVLIQGKFEDLIVMERFLV